MTLTACRQIRKVLIPTPVSEVSPEPDWTEPRLLVLNATDEGFLVQVDWVNEGDTFRKQLVIGEHNPLGVMDDGEVELIEQNADSIRVAIRYSIDGQSATAFETIPKEQGDAGDAL